MTNQLDSEDQSTAIPARDVTHTSRLQGMAFYRVFRRFPVLRYGTVLALDGAIGATSLLAALLLRFEGHIPHPYKLFLPEFLLFLASARILANFSLKLHRWSFRFSGLTDGLRVVLAGVLGSGLFLTFWYFYRVGLHLGAPIGPPRSTILLELLLSVFLMGMVRFSPRLAWMYLADRSRSRSGGTLRTLILGAGGCGEALLRDMSRSTDHNFKLVGFLDDDPAKQHMVLGGKPVFGSLDQLPEVAARQQIDNVLIAIPRLPARRIREILSQCAALKLRFKILPVSFIYMTDRAPSTMLQDLSPDDLLPRDPVTLTNGTGVPPMRGRSALVTGAAGSIGGETCRQLLANGLAELVMVDMNENNLYLLFYEFRRDFPEARIHLEVADIRDAGRMDALFRSHTPQDVFHAAAHKHVPLMEAAPPEAVKNNIFGTLNVATAADRHRADRFILISTDKAVRPTSVMGATKRVAEMIVRDFSGRSSTAFRAVRFGNVLGSAGSVVPLFKQQIAAGGPVTVTHPDVRRYFMTISEAVGLVLKAAYHCQGDLCVLDMGEQIRIDDLARHLVTMSGLVPDVDIAIEYVGLREGEKLFEELLTEEEESTVRASEKIFIAQGPPLADDLPAVLADLRAAAEAEDAAAIRDRLRRLIPSYHVVPSGTESLAPAASGRPLDSAVED